MTTDNSDRDSAAYAAFSEGYEQAEEAKPTLITADVFVSDDYAAKIARGECVVKFGESKVTDIDIKARDIKGENGATCALWPNIDTFTVEWLPPQPATLEASLTSLQDTLPKLSQSVQRLQGVIEEAKAAGGGGVSTIYNAYSFDYIPYAIKIEGGDNEHPVNYGVVKVYNRLLEETSVFIEEKEVNRLQAALAAERVRVAGLLAALADTNGSLDVAETTRQWAGLLARVDTEKLNIADESAIRNCAKKLYKVAEALEAVAITGSGEGGE